MACVPDPSDALAALDAVWTQAADRLRIIEADPVACADYDAIRQQVDQAVRIGASTFGAPYLAWVQTLADVSVPMMARVTGATTWGIVLNWLSAIAMRAQAFTLESRMPPKILTDRTDPPFCSEEGDCV
jgi:hypothetical protein